MTNRSEQSLTAIVEQVARQHYERQSALHGDSVAWEALDKYQQSVIKQTLLPIVWDVLNVADAAPVYIVEDIEGERAEVYREEFVAAKRTEEINERMGVGYGFYDTHPVRDTKPEHPHNGI